jgi:hypothetical protein
MMRLNCETEEQVNVYEADAKINLRCRKEKKLSGKTIIKKLESENYPYGGKVDIDYKAGYCYFNTTNSCPENEKIILRYNGWEGWKDEDGNAITKEEAAAILEENGIYNYAM